MRYLTLFIFHFSLGVILCQSTFISCSGTGSLSIVDKTRCCKKTIENIGIFSDIAITPSGEIFLIDTSLRKIDANGNFLSSVNMIDEYGNVIYGVGLLALDDNFLLMDYGDSLVKVNVTNGQCTNLGYLGHNCAGDFAKIDDTYFMSTSTNLLVKFILDQTNYSIQTIEVVGNIDSPYHAYGLFSLIDKNSVTSLFCVISEEIFEVNQATAAITFTCKIDNEYSNGTATYNSSFDLSTELGANIITPNGDNKNDFLLFDQESLELVQVINRWGNVVFESTVFPCIFNGTTKTGEQLTEGVYYYYVTDTFCESKRNRTIYELTIYK
jgi:hypothetical protein